MRFLILAFLFLGCGACGVRRAESPIVAVSGRIHLRDVDRFTDVSIQVPGEEIPRFLALVTPTKKPYEIHPTINYPVADISIERQDGTSSTVYVRSTGHNPPAVSIDGEHYFLGGKDEFPNGAVRVVQLLVGFGIKQE